MGELKSIPKDEKEQLNLLRSVLLNGTNHDIEEIRTLLNNKEQLAEKVNPIIEDKIAHNKENFDIIYGREVEDLIDRRISESPEQILQIISPLLGRLIKKYIAHQFQMLRDSIDEKIKAATSTKGFIGKIKGKALGLFGIKQGDLAVVSYSASVIKEVYVIRRHSGLLLGSYSIDNTIDMDMIGGMLTAIKSFVEDAFKDEKNKEELEMIEYGSYKIFIQNFYNYYIAVVISGAFGTADKDKLSDKMINFAEKELSTLSAKALRNTDLISNKLKEYFNQETMGNHNESS